MSFVSFAKCVVLNQEAIAMFRIAEICEINAMCNAASSKFSRDLEPIMRAYR